MKKASILLSVLILAAAVFSGCQLGNASKPTPAPTSGLSGIDISVPVFNDETARKTSEKTPEPTAEPVTGSTSEIPPEPTPYIAPEITGVPDGVVNPFNTKYGSPYNADGSLKNDGYGWWFGRNKTNQPPTATTEFDIRQFNGYYLGDITQKVIYLTFDVGYENGFTNTILDILKEKNVPAAFFLTKTNMEATPDITLRMVNEGHIVANHTVRHKKSYEQSDEDLRWELEETANYFKELTGQDMPAFFRFPQGDYSARTISLVNDMGYKTVFWSAAYVDWEVNNQPGRQAAFDSITKFIHPGCIMLLHAVSESNTQALADAIDDIRSQGYEFKPLWDLPEY